MEFFDWREDAITDTNLREIINQKESMKEIIGIIFYWEDTDIGLSMLIFQDYQISFNITINRLKINSSNAVDITNVNWYLERIIPL